jgi:hypothetical protein
MHKNYFKNENQKFVQEKEDKVKKNSFFSTTGYYRYLLDDIADDIKVSSLAAAYF